MNATELSMLRESINRIQSQDALVGAEAERAERTIAHLEARIEEIKTGKPAGWW
ncbi:hypothetical protein [Pseudohongiella sp. O18]|uniref:hypothetical protein n=1 Tax=Pseudohongiella sp. O18 TaxID=2904248 RepID=UPI001F381A71|nr:hypothetical protein [Pseudohongiella sp. O18]